MARASPLRTSSSGVAWTQFHRADRAKVKAVAKEKGVAAAVKIATGMKKAKWKPLLPAAFIHLCSVRYSLHGENAPDHGCGQLPPERSGMSALSCCSGEESTVDSPRTRLHCA